MSENNFIHELEQIQYGWVVCLKCHKTFFSMENAKYHFKNEHVDKNIASNIESTQEAQEELDFDQDVVWRDT